MPENPVPQIDVEGLRTKAQSHQDFDTFVGKVRSSEDTLVLLGVSERADVVGITLDSEGVAHGWILPPVDSESGRQDGVLLTTNGFSAGTMRSYVFPRREMKAKYDQLLSLHPEPEDRKSVIEQLELDQRARAELDFYFATGGVTFVLGAQGIEPGDEIPKNPQNKIGGKAVIDIGTQITLTDQSQHTVAPRRTAPVTRAETTHVDLGGIRSGQISHTPAEPTTGTPAAGGSEPRGLRKLIPRRRR